MFLINYAFADFIFSNYALFIYYIKDFLWRFFSMARAWEYRLLLFVYVLNLIFYAFAFIHWKTVSDTIYMLHFEKRKFFWSVRECDVSFWLYYESSSSCEIEKSLLYGKFVTDFPKLRPLLEEEKPYHLRKRPSRKSSQEKRVPDNPYAYQDTWTSYWPLLVTILSVFPIIYCLCKI